MLASLGSVDRHAFLWCRAARDLVSQLSFKLFTYIGTGGTAWVVLPLVRAWRTGKPLIPVGVLAAVVVWGVDAIASLRKVVTHRPRPFSSIPNVSVLIAHPGSGSFPSAHATTAFAGAVLLSWLCPRGRIAFATLATLTVRRTSLRDQVARSHRIGSA